MKNKEIHRISNHPVHIFNDNNEISPSSFIPFCEFGDMNGYMNPAFDFPTCKIFNPKIFNNQLCYQVDLNKFKDSFSSDNLKNGITFFVDMNEDRQFSWTNDLQLKNSGIKTMTKSSFYISNSALSFLAFIKLT